VKWKDGQTTWLSLKDIKESYPVNVAEHIIEKQLVEEPAFKCWVPFVMSKKDRIVSAVKARIA